VARGTILKCLNEANRVNIKKKKMTPTDSIFKEALTLNPSEKAQLID